MRLPLRICPQEFEKKLKKAKKSSTALTAMTNRLSTVAEKAQGVRESTQILSGDVSALLGPKGELSQILVATSQQIVSQVVRHGDGIQELRANYRREHAERRRLFNLVQELRGNIRVFCRCRPPSDRELSNTVEGQAAVCVSFPEDAMVRVANDRQKEREWEFDQTFGFDASQEEVYVEVSPLVTSVLDGYNVCIFACE